MVLSGARPQLEQFGLVGVALARFRTVRDSLTFVQLVLKNMVIFVHWMEGGSRFFLVDAKDLENSLEVMLTMFSAR